MLRSKTKTQLNNAVVVRCVNCFKSVSVPSRMVIYNYLHFTKPEATVGDIVEQVKLTQPTVSYHLKEMKHSGLLKSKKIGKEVYYSVNQTCPYHKQTCVLHNLKFPEN